MFTQYEIELLEILWKENQPLTKAEIVARSPNQMLKPAKARYEHLVKLTKLYEE